MLRNKFKVLLSIKNYKIHKIITLKLKRAALQSNLWMFFLVRQIQRYNHNSHKIKKWVL